MIKGPVEAGDVIDTPTTVSSGTTCGTIQPRRSQRLARFLSPVTITLDQNQANRREIQATSSSAERNENQTQETTRNSAGDNTSTSRSGWMEGSTENPNSSLFRDARLVQLRRFVNDLHNYGSSSSSTPAAGNTNNSTTAADANSTTATGSNRARRSGGTESRKFHLF